MLTSSQRDFILHHVFLPPKLPQTFDGDKELVALLAAVRGAVRDFTHQVQADHNDKWSRITANIQKWIQVYHAGAPCESDINKAVESMQNEDILLLYIKCQNAAIMIRKETNCTVFEAFEVQSMTNSVLAAADALCRTFPARSITVKAEAMQRKSFVRELSSRLYKLSIEQTSTSMEKSYKGGTDIAETRQSEDPRLVTEWLFAVLASEGRESTTTLTVTKRTHDEVRWERALLAWRRSAMWLSFKVALQLSCQHYFDKDGRSQYKNFMIFLLSRLSDSIVKEDDTIDVPHILRAKLARRHAKLSNETMLFVTKAVTASLDLATSTLEQRWTSVAARERITVPKITTATCNKEFLLVNSFSSLRKIWAESQQSFKYPKQRFSPATKAHFTLDSYVVPNFATVLANIPEGYSQLLVIEDWISQCLPGWVDQQVGTEEDGSKLAALMSAYFEAAKVKYHGIPEKSSLMLLCTVELWVALDKLASRLLPLLKKYLPPLKPNMLSCLLLQKRQQLQRLSAAETYIENRHQTASLPSFDALSANSFGVHYFRESDDLQLLKKRIEYNAEQERADLRARYDQLCAEQQRLLASVCDEEHQNFYMWWNGRTRHDKFCHRCVIEEQAYSMTIEKHEWPLPNDDTLACAAVFELQPPEVYVSWRDASWMLLQDVIRSSSVGASDVQGRLFDYAPLKEFIIHEKRRIVFASFTKSMERSHYHVQNLNLESIFVEHCMKYKLYDCNIKAWTQQQEPQYTISRYCRSEAPTDLAPVLKKAINGTNQGQNAVIAEQSKCPIELAVHEFVAIGSLRSGGHLQWMNILTNLLTGQINLNNDLVLTIIEQMALQAGPRGTNSEFSAIRDQQQDFMTSTFPIALAKAVSSKLDSIEANWKENETAGVLLLIIHRILVFSTTDATEQAALEMLRRLRRITLQWLRSITDVSTTQDADQSSQEISNGSKGRLLSIAMVARATWNVDVKYLSKLFEEETDVGDYIECSIHIHDWKSQLGDDQKVMLSKQIRRDDILATELQVILVDTATSQDGTFTAGLQRALQGMQFDSVWSFTKATDGVWATNHGNDLTQVQYNVLSGRLLVAGKPLSLLPDEYVKHEIYSTIFGSYRIKVIASDVSDMEYRATNLISGHAVYLGLRSHRLVIRSQCDGKQHEAIPLSVLHGDIPPLLMQGRTAWMNLQDGVIAFRLRNKTWSSELNKSDLIVYFNSGSASASELRYGSKKLVSQSSVLGHSICRIFRNFEQGKYLHISRDSETMQVGVELPRYQLNFFVNANGLLQCRELTATIAQDQSIRSLHGLRTRLLLQAVTSSMIERQETVLIPHGEVSVTSEAPHVTVVINTGDLPVTTYYQYRVDRLLGQLTSNGDLDAHFFKTYLHAITSSLIPDGLTSRTGTAEALSNLSDSLTRTNNPLSHRSATVLKNLASLTPVRVFYPPDKTVMEQVRWHPCLSQFSQHNLFTSKVQEIVDHNRQALLLFPDQDITVQPYRGEPALLYRALLKAAKYYPTMVSSSVSCHQDVVYRSRDRDSGTAMSEAFRVSDLVGRWPSKLETNGALYKLLVAWKNVTGFQTSFQTSSLSAMLNVDMARAWPSLFQSHLSSSRTDQDKLRFDLSLMVFGNAQTRQYIPTLLAFAIDSRLKDLSEPEHDSYSLSHGHTLDWRIINSHIEQCSIKHKPIPLSPPSRSETKDQTDARRKQLDEDNEADRKRHDAEAKRYAEEVKAAIKQCWPDESVDLPTQTSLRTVDEDALQKMLNSSLELWYKNHQLYHCCDQYSRVLKDLNGKVDISKLPISIIQPCHQKHDGSDINIPTLLSLLQSLPTLPDNANNLLSALRTTGIDSSIESLQIYRLTITNAEQDIIAGTQSAVADMIEDLSTSSDLTDHEYAMTLSDSVEAAHKKHKNQLGRFNAPLSSRLVKLHKRASHVIDIFLEVFKTATVPRSQISSSLNRAGLWPQATRNTLLQLLSIQHRGALQPHWIEFLVGFANAITAMQRVSRLQKYSEANDDFALHKELENEAHGSWNTHEFPDWLLLEIQNDMLIRPVQIRVAKEMMCSSNASLMLNMGEGKTSVILPMVITAMAEGSKLLRVIVLKPLATEMLRTLSQSLSGLVNRPVYYLPFSRHTKLDLNSPGMLLNLYKQCKDSFGMLLTLPEYLNSFRLIGSDRLSAKSDEVLAVQLLGVQKWLDSNTRDVIDECDELLKPAYELVYTNGEPKQLQHAPTRWVLILELLSLVQLNAANVKKELPDTIEIEQNGDTTGFGVRILADAGWSRLEHRLIKAIMRGGLMGMPFGHCSSEEQSALHEFIVSETVSTKSAAMVLDRFSNSTIIDNLYLLRGLFRHRILVSALSKRWNVNYGLDRSRCLSAVPYRARATPAPAAEYAQSEMMIVLTALSYYNTGLTLEETHSTLIRLLKSPDPADEYAKWTSGLSTPTDLRNLAAINIEDPVCIQRIHNHLNTNKRVVDFFLNHLVFPKEAKEFPHKLSTSAWDLCTGADKKVTTGFSGTGDSLLPLSMPYKDLRELRHTPAAVLCTLLRPENQSYIHAIDSDGKPARGRKLLELIVANQRMPSVILDVGAQLMSSNRHIAQQWLALRRDKRAAVYFDEDDQKMVVDRSTRSMRWASSPYRDQPSDCIYFLDECHTRGVDFQFPDHFCGAVLLGPGLQKDTLVQACLRMRKLGFTQSVVFYAPPEVHNTIISRFPDVVEPTSYEVLLWTIHNSCAGLRSQKTLWLMRGLAQVSRKSAFDFHVDKNGTVVDEATYLSKLREVESRPLSEMYSTQKATKMLEYQFTDNEKRDKTTSQLLNIWNDMDATVARERSLDENAEIERENLHEIELEREVQRPREVKPAKMEINQQLWAAIRGEPVDKVTSELMPYYDLFSQTSLKDAESPGNWPGLLGMTRGFRDTIVRNNDAPVDDFLRSSQWLLRIKTKQVLILISPAEANAYMPALRKSKTAVLILYAARTMKVMTSFDKFDIYVVPEQNQDIYINSTIAAALRLFAGQLYFNNMNEYELFCEMLGLWDGKRVLEEEGKDVALDLFVSPKCRELNRWTCNFTQSPVSYITQWINMRRAGLEWSHTHVGRVLSHQVLTERDFE